jgi:hypothetical protein
MTDWNNKEEVLGALWEGGLDLEKASEELRADKEVVLAAVSSYGIALEYASEELQGDPEILKLAKESIIEEIKYGELYTSSGDIVTLEDCPEQFRSDDEVVLAALQGDGENLKFASDEVKNNRSFVLTALSGCFLPHRLQTLGFPHHLAVLLVRLHHQI